MGRHKSVLGVAVVLLLAVGSCVGQEPLSGCGSQTMSCSQCIQYHPDCVWCPSPPRTDSMNMQVRCQNRTSVSCSSGLLVQDPSSSVAITRNNLNASVFRVSPQSLNITARPGDSQSFELTVRPTNDFPLDLYILMDFSSSLDRPLERLREIANNITITLRSITENFQIGFGTFIDKRALPYSPTSLVTILPISGNESCTTGRLICVPTYSFLHQLPMTNSLSDFQMVLDQAQISGNIDNPEGGLDGLVQAAVCDEIIGWRESSLRMLLFFTDNEYHIAGDGKLAGIVRPNDGRCHTEQREEDDFYEYVLDTTFDYPSIYQLNSLLIENEIIPVFANTNPDFIESYSTLAGLLDSAQSVLAEAEQLTNIIRDAYNDLTRVANVVPTAVNNVNFRVEPLCNDSTPDNGCLTVIGQEVTFRVSVTLESCTDALRDGGEIPLTVRVPGFGSTIINLRGVCNCDCEEDTSESIPNDEACSSNGTLVCGLCVCNEGRFGTTCQCTEQINPCPVFNGMECAGRGTCDDCNECVCNQQPGSESFFFGSDCRCDNTSCVNNCGGPERGVCDCDSLMCTCLIAEPVGLPFFGESCQCDPNLCFNEAFPDVQCQNVGDGPDGTCACNRCDCPPGHDSINGTCVPRPCVANRPCARCTAGLMSGTRTSCADLEGCNGILLNGTTAPPTYMPCMFVNDTCEVSRNYFIPRAAIQAEDPSLPIFVQRCIIASDGVEAWIIAVAIVGGILLLGLLILIIIKLILLILERIDYNRFVKQMEEAEWAPHENPLYLSPQQDFKNVAYKKRGGSRH